MFQPDIVVFWITRRRCQERKEQLLVLAEPAERKAVTISAGGLNDNNRQMSEGDVGSAGSIGVPGTDELLSVASESSETSVKDKHPKCRQAFPKLSNAASELG